ncbi:MAG: hypothetical protein U0X20_07335 [Caldilineaceae bacterium]
MPDDTIRPWLTLEQHMRILRSLWDQRPPQLPVKIEVPVLIAAAEDAIFPNGWRSSTGKWRPRRRCCRR